MIERSRGIVFLDRDGTLNLEVNRLCSPDRLELIPKAGEAVRRLNHAGFLAVLVTNQSIIARGECSLAGLEEIHDRLKTLLAEEGASLDAIYYCPHHPDPESDRAVAELSILCDCRKPGTAMIEHALAEFSLAASDAWMIGDTTVDLKTAQNAGIRSILVQTGYAGTDRRWSVRPDHEFSNLHEAVEFVIDC
jgi:histidinol-phosphate phosphatase family protein